MILQLALSAIAYGAAVTSDNPIVRVLGIGFLFARSIMYLLAGIFGGFNVVPIAIGILLLGLAIHAWLK